jgi:hypothetical protein|tara:strand:+ start:500 stop:712 length:213 start_codon:yes stop_codon:yes gene_type:complete
MAYKQKSTVKSLCSGSAAKMNADLKYDPINDDADSPMSMYGKKETPAMMYGKKETPVKNMKNVLSGKQRY